MVKEHWAAPFLPDKIEQVRSLNQGLQHHSDKVILGDGSQWVCKRFAAQTWLGMVGHDNLLLSEQFAALVSTRFATTCAAFQPLNMTAPIFYVEDSLALIKPYCPGRLKTVVTPKQAQHLALALAQLHSLAMKNEQARVLPNIHYRTQDTDPAWLLADIDYCNHYRCHRQQEFIVSHRDLHLQNVVWPNSHTVHILDWESVGLIHPFTELIGVALNCAGITTGQFKPQHFVAVVQAYAQSQPLPRADDILWRTNLHTWLLWYSYVCKRGWIAQHQRLLTLITTIKEWLPAMQTLYDNV